MFTDFPVIIDIFKAVVLGIVEGVTEFLPISSTGHLILVNQFVTFDDTFTVLFDIVIQLGAILAVVVYFIKKLWPFTSDATHNQSVRTIWYKTILGVIPALALGALFADYIQATLFNPLTVAISLIVGGCIILWVEHAPREPRTTSTADMTFRQAFYIGLVQCIAMIPGVSRSGATIIGGMMLGTSRSVATEFSFFLAIPTIAAASMYSLLKYDGVLDVAHTIILSVGFLVSFIVALATVSLFLRFVQHHNFKAFGIYRIVLGLIITVLLVTF